MNFFKKLYCRIFQGVFKIALPILPYRNPNVYYNVKDVCEIIKKQGYSRTLLVTDKNLRQLGITLKLEQALKDNDILVALYDKTDVNPTVDNVEEALSLYKQNNCQCIVAFGGGSPMDCAKIVGARVAYPKKSVSKMKGILKINKKIPTLIAIPTTAGTGSETTVAAVITDSKTHYKYPINSFPLIPSYAILDAEVTYSLPKSLTSTTGIDALTHAVEAYIGRSTTKETRKLSKEACKLIFENILVSYNNPNDKDARTNMLIAAHKAGIAFTKSYVGYVHAVAHSLGGKYNVPHGLANSVILPHVLELYGKKIYKKLYQLALYCNLANKEDSYKVAANKFIEAIKKLNLDMCIPNHIQGIKDEDISKLAKLADKEANPLYPVPVLMNAKEL